MAAGARKPPPPNRRKDLVMSGVFSSAPITERVHWVGAIDWNVRDFHGYATTRGTTYNAYLVIADKITLIDTVKRPFFDELMGRVASIIGDPSRIDYVISNHSEMDHTGVLVETVRAVKPEKVYASVMGKKALAAHFHGAVDAVAVENGSKLNLGGAEFTFVETRMLHWPDSMMTYLAGDNVLFSQDGFGMHLAASQRFDDQVNQTILEYEVAKYYANILMPYSPMVKKGLATIAGLGVPIDVIAPDHGPIWRKKLDWILGLYDLWSRQEPTKRAVIVYDTMWESTDKLAAAVGEGLVSGGVEVQILKMGASHRSDVANEVLNAGALIVGSPTINNQMFPTVADVLYYLRGLKPKNKVGAAFGSYGWSGEAVKHISDILEGMGVELVGESVNVLYVPDKSHLAECRKLGEAVAARLCEICD